MSAIEWPSITHSYVESANLLSKGTKVVEFSLFDRITLKSSPMGNMSEPFTIVVPRSGGNESMPEPNTVNTTKELRGLRVPLIYTMINISKFDSVLNIELGPIDYGSKLFFMLDCDRMPTLKRFEWRMAFSRIDSQTEDAFDFFYNQTYVANRTGRFFLGVGELKDDKFDMALLEDYSYELKKSDLNSDKFRTDYTVRMYTSGCYYFKEEWSMWTSDGLTVIASDYNSTTCEATHLSAFGSGFFPQPNAIDFSYVFANAGFADNLTIYMCIIITLSFYIILMVWAKRKDIRDKESLGCLALPDNKPEDKYIYEITIITGNNKDAMTDSIISFIISGEHDETDIRTFGNVNRHAFKCGETDSFVMTVPSPLGELSYLRIWHDNSGIGRYASWYLNYVVIRDIQTTRQYEFIANKWLSLEDDDGQIDRVLPAAGMAQKKEFSHLFNNTSEKKLRDAHLWLSVFMRPARSRFTRCQRVSSCMAFLYLSMLTSAMFYGVVPEKPGANAIDIGPMSLTPEQIGVGLISNLITFPPSFLIIFMFRNSRRRQLRPNRIEKAITDSQKSTRNNNNRLTTETTSRTGTTVKKFNNDNNHIQNSNPMRKTHDEKLKKKKPFMLPWYCRYIGWLLVFVSMVVSVFFLWAYGITFGNKKTTKWLTSLLISFFSSVLLVEPLKIILVAFLLSLVCKSGDFGEDDIEQDEEEFALHKDESFPTSFGYYDPTKQRAAPPATINSERIEKMRLARQKELKMWSILREIVAYLVFLWILIVISYGNRDPSAFLLRNTLTDNFITRYQYDKVTNSNEFWIWANEAILNELRVQPWYNGEQPYGLKGFLNDRVNRIMGFATLRQVRIKPNTCSVPLCMHSVTRNCSAYTHYIDEDKESYCKGWLRRTAKNMHKNDCKMQPFLFKTAKELDGLPIIGQFDAYGGGGYTMNLSGWQENLEAEMRDLRRARWIDRRTRAVFLEFSVYNAQVNLFGVATIKAEFMPGGGITPSWRFDGVRLLRYHVGFGLFLVICEIAFILYIFYYTYVEIAGFMKLKKKYFQDAWNFIEILLCGISYAAVILYVWRYFATQAIVKTFERTHGNGYMKLQFASTLDEVFGYLVAFLVFLATLKFIKLLRFNKRMGVLTYTLNRAWNDLVGFFLVFGILFWAFVQLFFMILNKNMQDYSSFVSSFETCFTAMLGKFHFSGMQKTSMLASVLFFMFILCTTFIMINILLTIIITAFNTVKKDLLHQPSEYEIVDFMKTRLKMFVGLEKSASAIHPDVTGPVVKQPDSKKDDKVEELPSKVHHFLEYVNSMYFDGCLDLDSKDAMRQLRTQSQRHIYGTDESVGHTSSTLRHPRVHTPAARYRSKRKV